jgi:hypothetical protein
MMKILLACMQKSDNVAASFPHPQKQAHNDAASPLRPTLPRQTQQNCTQTSYSNMNRAQPQMLFKILVLTFGAAAVLIVTNQRPPWVCAQRRLARPTQLKDSA